MVERSVIAAPRIGPGLATLGVVAASVAFGLVPYFARSLVEGGMAAHAVAFYRYVLAAVVFLPVLWAVRRDWGALVWGVAAGAVMGLGWIGYVRALELAPVATVGVIYMTYPIFTLLLAWAIFGDRPAARSWLAAPLILLAALLAGSGALAGIGAGQGSSLVLLLALAAPVGFGFAISVLVHRLTRLPPVARIGAVSLGSLVGLVPLMLGTEPAALVPADRAGWMLVLGIGLGSALVPQLIYTVCSPLIGTARTAMAGAVELPTMFLVGWVAFGEAPGPLQALACLLVVGAILLTPSKPARLADAEAEAEIARGP